MDFVESDSVTDLQLVNGLVVTAVGLRTFSNSHGVNIYKLNAYGNLTVTQENIRYAGKVVESIWVDGSSAIYVCVGNDLKIYSSVGYQEFVEVSSINVNPTGQHSKRPVDVVVHNERAYVACGKNGMVVVKVSEADSPSIVGVGTDVGEGYYKDAVIIDDGGVYVCVVDSMPGGTTGEFVKLLTSADQPLVIDELVMEGSMASGQAGEMIWSGEYIYVASGIDGMRVIGVESGTMSEVGRGGPWGGYLTDSQEVSGLCFYRDYLMVSSYKYDPYYYQGEINVFSRQCGDILPTTTRYNNVSSQVSGLDYLGLPYSSVLMDLGGTVGRGMFVTTKEYPAVLYAQGMAVDVPVFLDLTDIMLPATLAADLRGVTTADYDNDGQLDIIVAGDSGAALYRNTGNGYSDETINQNLSAYLDHSWMGAWGDYDRDGLVDLYICRGGDSVDPDQDPLTIVGQQDYLLRNTGSGFVDVTSSAGMSIAPTASLSASWADADQDGDIDLFVGYYSDAPLVGVSHYYVNQDNGAFVDEYTSAFAAAPNGINAVTWNDVDSDGDMDIVLSSRIGESMVFINYPAGIFNSVTHVPVAEGQEANGLVPVDHNMDGLTDLIVLPYSGEPRVLENRPYYAGLKFFDQTAEVGFADGGRIDGISVSDIDGDGDPDFYVGRPLASSSFFYTVEENLTGAGLTNAPQNDWVGVELAALPGNNAASIGTLVEFQAGIFTKVMMVDGGQGRGGQGDPILKCGLGDYAGTDVHVVIHWPGGYSQEEDIPVGVVTFIEDDTVPTIVVGSLGHTLSYLPNQMMEWTISWETMYSCQASLDEVRIDIPNEPDTMIETGTSTVTAKQGGGYYHEVNIVTPCVTGSYWYQVASATQKHVSESSTKRQNIRYCVTN